MIIALEALIVIQVEIKETAIILEVLEDLTTIQVEIKETIIILEVLEDLTTIQAVIIIIQVEIKETTTLEDLTIILEEIKETTIILVGTLIGLTMIQIIMTQLTNVRSQSLLNLLLLLNHGKTRINQQHM